MFFMISGFITLLLIIWISFFPVVIWAYIFTYIDDSHLSKKRLLSGVFAWSISVAPILFMQDFLSFFKLGGIDIFSLFHTGASFHSWIPAFLSLLLFLSCFMIFSLVTQLILKKKIRFTDSYKGSTFVFLWGIIWTIILFFLLKSLPFLMKDIWNLVNMDGIVLNSVWLVIAYYIVIALLEEWSKHFQFLSDTSDTSIRKWVLYAIFIALGFSFVENILYTYFLYLSSGFTSELLKLYFFRGVFSIILHILCTSILAYSSLSAFEFSIPRRTQIFIIWFIASISLHALFDIALTLWFSLVLLFYFIWWYLYVSSLFYGGKPSQ